MKKEDVLKAINDLENIQKKKFKQSFDLSIALKGLDLKKPENRIESYFVLPHGPGKEMKVCAFVDKDMVNETKDICDKIIKKEEFETWEKKPIKKLAREFDYFIAQATLMPQVAGTFGKYLSVVGKMPSPTSKTIFGPSIDMKALVEKLKKTVRLLAKKQPVVNCIIGKEGGKPNEIADNAIAVYNEVVSRLPEKERQVKHVYLKLTMSKPVKIW
jgi:large subunit ribosomal protein L1